MKIIYIKKIEDNDISYLIFMGEIASLKEYILTCDILHRVSLKQKKRKKFMIKNNVKRQIRHFDERAISYFNARNQKKNIYYRTLLFSYCLRGIEIEKELLYVLDPMCGYGTGYKAIKGIFRGKRIIYKGFDASPEIVNIARRIYPDAEFNLSDVLEMSDNEKYDILIVLGGYIMFQTMQWRFLRSFMMHLFREAS